ncbi:phosphonate C-P lyase system protein PhnH [Rhodophyticola porphyridii]|uniref:Phosphonate C-P lyase system protein PhnH n=1 Tax=Rhodophyticola porphyridii TaxID=1852017 RepID=A0A3L9Y768_9RHOB|nr:phosphonate C-P lyase system protein PhnH [Rhodophyticola porphyridii]RMA44262.1 phosphonate C-P lyase system protein PhnH [Rhodophyticola porphyridii]
MSAPTQSDAMTGGFEAPAFDAAFAFRAVLQAMARPGRIETVSRAAPPTPISAAAGAVILTLCDPETGVYLAPGHDTDAARAWITFHTGAPFVRAEAAVFALGTWDALAPLSAYAIGTPEYPDRSATLIVECDGLYADGAVLSGPGIRDRARLNLPEIAAFRANRARFPLGFDCIFTAGAQLAALPRSTQVTEAI